MQTLLFPERVTAVNDRRDREAVIRRRRRDSPLKRITVPRVGACGFPLPNTDDHIDGKEQNPKEKDEGADGRDQIVDSPSSLRWIGVNAARHAHQSKDMHWEEGNVEADEHQPEVPASQALAEQLTGELGQPVIETGKDREDHTTDQHIMEMRHHEIGIMHLPVQRDGCSHASGDTAEDEYIYRDDNEQEGRIP